VPAAALERINTYLGIQPELTSREAVLRYIKETYAGARDDAEQPTNFADAVSA
jgi:hypothetical protein